MFILVLEKNRISRANKCARTIIIFSNILFGACEVHNSTVSSTSTSMDKAEFDHYIILQIMHRISLSLEMHKIAENPLERFFTTIFPTPSGGGSGPCLLTL